MKIRTTFVTNSSSSSYIVSFAKDKTSPYDDDLMPIQEILMEVFKDVEFIDGEEELQNFIKTHYVYWVPGEFEVALEKAPFATKVYENTIESARGNQMIAFIDVDWGAARQEWLIDEFIQKGTVKLLFKD